MSYLGEDEIEKKLPTNILTFLTKILYILDLSHLGSTASADQQQLFLTYSNLISSAKKLAQNLESLEATLSSTTSSQDSRLASL